MNAITLFYYKFRVVSPAEYLAILLCGFAMFLMFVYGIKCLFWPSEMEGDRKRRLISTALLAMVVGGIAGYFGWKGYQRISKAETLLMLARSERFERAEGSLVTVGAVARDETGDLVGVEPILTLTSEQWRNLWALMQRADSARGK